MFENTFTQKGISIQELKQMFNGRLIAPGDQGYEKASTPLYGGFDHRPAAIIRPIDANQVAQVVNLARQTGLELAVRSGGHSLAAHSLCQDGIVLDLVNLQDLQIDAANRTAWAQSGLTTGMYTGAAAAHGLVTGFGDTATVGLGGLTTGGGVGYLVRKFGMTIDHLLAAEVVTADGQLLYTDEQSHPDLFWALRGGGGNFGVVTRFKFALHPLDQVYGGMLVLPATADVVVGMVKAAQAASDDLSIIAVIMKAPPLPFLPAELHGKMILLLNLVYAGPLSEAEKALKPLRSLAAPLADMLRPLPYPQMFMEEEGGDFHPLIASQIFFSKSFDRAAAQNIIDHIQSSTAMMSICQIRILGGAMARVPVDATAYPHRQEEIMVYAMAMYGDPGEGQVSQNWVDTLVGMMPKNGCGQYINFMGVVDAATVQSAYPEATWNRLTRIKGKYDPGNLFHRNQNIPPVVD